MEKITLTSEQLGEMFHEVILEMDTKDCDECQVGSRDVISEALSATDKSEIKTILKKEIKDFLDISRSADLDKKVSDIVKNKFKNDKDVEKHIVDIVRNVLVQLYKNLWTRRNFWANDLKNAPQ